MIFRRSNARSAGLQWRLAAIAGICLLSQVAALVHQTLVRHEICAEHGESVHVRAAREDAAGRVVVDPPRAAASLRQAPAIADEGHEHCSVALVRAATFVPDRGLPVAVDVVPRDGGEAATDVFDRGVACYLVAPKTSPGPLA